MQLTVVEYAGRPAKSKTSVEFLPPGGTIGRNADNLLVLPDETRRISRLQALLNAGSLFPPLAVELSASLNMDDSPAKQSM